MLLIPNWNEPVDPRSIFPPTIQNFHLEFGSGFGEVAIALAKSQPKSGFVLWEKKIDRIVSTEKKRERFGLQNIRYVAIDGNWFLGQIFQKSSFDELLINFPDPWPKKKHWKNRLLQDSKLEEILAFLKPGGLVRIATDYGPYARKILRLLRNRKDLAWNQREWSRERKNFPVSHYELEKQKEGKRIYYFERKKI